MKNLYIIGGTMGVGKTAVCQKLKTKLCRSVFLDGDRCWDSHPFCVTEETKLMVKQNICFLLNQFIRCSAYENIIFCWVMHEQQIIDEILDGIDTASCNVKIISLMCDEATLRCRLQKDVMGGIRTEDIIDRSIARLKLYEHLNTIKLDTNGKTADEVAEQIANLREI